MQKKYVLKMTRLHGNLVTKNEKHYSLFLLSIFRMNFEDLAMMMLLTPDLLTDEDILLLLLAECETNEEPDHYKYERFNFDNCSPAQFKQYFHFEKEHISLLRKQLSLRDVYHGINGIKWSGDEGLCILL